MLFAIVISSQSQPPSAASFFFFNDTAATEIYPLSLPDALPIFVGSSAARDPRPPGRGGRPGTGDRQRGAVYPKRSEEHTSELQSPCNLVCRLLLEKKKTTVPPPSPICHPHAQHTRTTAAHTRHR